jgi:hypothetical protein
MDDRMRGKVIVGIMVAAAPWLLGAATVEAQPGRGWRGSGHSRQTIEIWQVLPNSRRFEDSNLWLPECNSLRTRPGRAETEIYFRIVHLPPGCSKWRHCGHLPRTGRRDRPRASFTVYGR